MFKRILKRVYDVLESFTVDERKRIARNKMNLKVEKAAYEEIRS